MNIFSYIKTKIQILDVISEYTSLKKAGNYWKGQCPFHNEKTASFTVSPHKEIYYCFGCHTSGDVITFISMIENCSQIEAAKHLAKIYQIDLPQELSKELPNQTKEKENYFTLCQLVADWCNQQLLKTPAAMQYVQKRGFTPRTINLYNIGYFPAGYTWIKALCLHLQKYSFMQGDLIEAKIIAEGKKATYSPFEDRIMFPIKDIIGRYCGFGGRIFKPDDQRPKYYNSHENPYFTKGSLLFGFDLAKKSLGNKDHLFMVEGYTDCIFMSQSGFSNTVATLGTACTQEHLKIISRYVNYLYVLYDGDQAGKNAIMRLTELCWQVNIELKVIILPENEDPASFLQKGGNLLELIDKAKDIFMFFIDSIGQNFLSKALSEKLKLANDVIEKIENIQDPLKRDILLQKASNVMQIPIDSVNKNKKTNFYPKNQKYLPNSGPSNINSTTNNGQKSEFNQQITSRTGQKNISGIEVKTGVKLTNDDLRLEKKIFFAIINNIELITEEHSEFLLEYLPSPVNEIFKKFKIDIENINIENGSGHNFVSFFETLKDNEKEYISKLLLEFDDKIDKKTFEQLFLQFQKKHWKNIVKKIMNNLEIAKKEADEQKMSLILDKFNQLKKKMLQ